MPVPALKGEIFPMLWWLIGLWLASPALLAIVWLLGGLKASAPEKPETAHR